MPRVTRGTFGGFEPIAFMDEDAKSFVLNQAKRITPIKVPQVNQMLHLLLRCHPDYSSLTHGLDVLGFCMVPDAFIERSFYFILEDESIRSFDVLDCLLNI